MNMKMKLRMLAGKIWGCDPRTSKNREWRGFYTLTFLSACLVLVGVFAQIDHPKVDKTRKFSPKEELTTTRSVLLTTTREVWDSYPPEYGISKKADGIEITSDIYDRTDPKKVGKVKVPKGTYYRGVVTYPAGSKVRILATNANGKSHTVLMGPSREQFKLNSDTILEAGGTPGKQVFANSIQAPKITINWDGPNETLTGIATGDEDIKSSDLAWEKKFFELSNHARASNRLPALVWNEDIARAARYHAARLYIQIDVPADSRPVTPGVSENGISVEETVNAKIDELWIKESVAYYAANPRRSPSTKEEREAVQKVYFESCDKYRKNIARIAGYSSIEEYLISEGGHNTMASTGKTSEEAEDEYKRMIDHWRQRVERFNPLIRAENWAMRPRGETPEKLLKVFMSSSTNQGNILGANYKSAGVGIIQGKAGMIVLMNFGL